MGLKQRAHWSAGAAHRNGDQVDAVLVRESDDGRNDIAVQLHRLHVETFEKRFGAAERQTFAVDVHMRTVIGYVGNCGRRGSHHDEMSVWRQALDGGMKRWRVHAAVGHQHGHSRRRIGTPRHCRVDRNIEVIGDHGGGNVADAALPSARLSLSTSTYGR